MNLPTFIALTWDMPNLSHAEQARAFCEGGSRFLQMRSKAPSSSGLLSDAVEFVEVCREFGALGIINDFPRLALETNADGVHLGSKDGSRLEARRFLGSDALIGGTVNSLADAEKIVSEGVNSLRNKERSFLIITHYQRLLDYIKPDFVHVLINGKIAKTGCSELALELDKIGYEEMRASK